MMLHYIHIQGKDAPGYYFRDKTAQHFKSMIQSICEGSALVISSLYRSDVFYLSHKELTLEIFKLWALQEKTFDPSKLKVFSGRESVLEYFFTSLVVFSAAHKWYEAYLNEFRSACSMDKNNPILKDLKACEDYLQETQHTIHRPATISNTRDFLPKKEVYEDLLRHINDFQN